MSNAEYPSSVIIVKNITGAKEVKETHISYALIGEEYVYKIKKAVDFGFLNYKLSKNRRMYTILEKDLNDRFSNGIYLDALKLVRLNEKEFSLVPIENSLTAIEYVLKMKRIPDNDFLQTRIDKGLISSMDMEQIGSDTALLLRKLENAPKDEEFDTHFDVVKFNAEENFTQTAEYVGKFIDKAGYDFIKDKTLKFLHINQDLFNQRAVEGYVKNGHGDLRLEHIFFDKDNNTGLIDCIEFNKRFRFNDVVSEAAFLSMELDAMGRIDLADSFISGFLSVFNDGISLKLLNYYKCYLSFVRAKVTCFLVASKDNTWEYYDDKVKEIKKHIDMACIYAKAMETENIIFFGLMGTGKSKNALIFGNRFPVAVLSSDIIRKELFGLNRNNRQYIDWNTGIYSHENSLLLYNKLGKMVEDKHKVGRISLVDASFTKKSYLQEYMKYNIGNITFIEFDAPLDEINARLLKREEKRTITDGRIAIEQAQRKNAEMPECNLKIITTGKVQDNIEEIYKYLIK